MSNAFLRTVLAVLAVACIIMGAWLAVPTRLFFNPTAVTIEGYSVTVTRSFPLAEHFRIPVIRYTETVRAIDGPVRPCIDAQEFRYTDNGLPYGKWSIRSWAEPCMRGGFTWHAEWSARLFGVIPLRPVDLDTVVIRDR